MAFPVVPAAVADETQQLVIDGHIRTYLIHNPVVSNKPLPLVLAFHGSGGTAGAFAATAGLDALADARGFLVVYPQSYRAHWNAALVGEGVDDVAFTAAIIAAMQRSYTGDKVYAIG